ncbi:MAG: hypothetical protein H0X34_10615 [Chthoniobacterales bacterium]|nr:hypothetical protein [Chthoniobacterales bacterium]
MKRQRRLTVEVDPEETPEFLAALDRALNNGWTRDLRAEELSSPLLRPYIACYRCDARDNRPSAQLALSRETFDRFAVARVKFQTYSPTEITTDEQNRVITDFHHSCLGRIISTTTAYINMWSDSEPPSERYG